LKLNNKKAIFILKLEQTTIEIDKIEKNKVQVKKQLDDKSIEKKNLEQEIEKLNTTIVKLPFIKEHLKKEEHLKKLEDYITKNVNDILIFDKFKSIVASNI
jgi:hypothetical protein